MLQVPCYIEDDHDDDDAGDHLSEAEEFPNANLNDHLQDSIQRKRGTTENPSGIA